MPTVRRARVEDAPAIADIHVRAWRAAYRGIMPDAVVDHLDVDERRERWAVRLSGGNDVLVAVADDGRVAGFSATGAVRDDTLGAPPVTPSTPGLGELWVINLAPEHWGQGVGRMLLDAATEQLRLQGYTEAVLWVVEENARARRFYEKAGWRTDGGRKIDGENHVTEVRYRRAL